jgi:hypothetical protein
MLHGELADHALQLSDAGVVFLQAAVARKGPFSIVEMLLAPSDEPSGMDLILARGLGRGFPRLKFADHLECELTRKARTVESQGYASFPFVRKLNSLSQSRGAVQADAPM